jgi:hypothetical protein
MNKSTLIALMKFLEDSGIEIIDEEDAIGIKLNKLS